jgi:anti-sigma regulatory factor (Ser/Thr protein kinase)
MRVADRQLLLRDAGGAWFLDRGALLVVVPSIVLTSGLATGPDADALFLRWAAAGALALLPCWLLVELARRGPFRDRAIHAVSLPTVVAFGALLGAVKALGTGWLAVVLGVQVDATDLYGGRLVGAMTAGALLLPIAAILRAGLAQVRAERDVLIMERLHAALQGAQLERTDVDDEVRALVDRSLRRVGSSAPGGVSRALRAVIDERIRPLTEDLRTRGDARPRDVSLWGIVRLAITTRPIPLLPVAVGVAIAVLARYAIPVGGGRAVLGGLAAAVGAGLGLLPVWLLARRRAHVPLVGVFASTLLAAVLQVIVGDVGFGYGLGLPAVLDVTLAWILLAQLVLVIGVLSAANSDREGVRRDLVAMLGPTGMQRALERAQDGQRSLQLADHLHSDLQNRLLAAAVRIESLGEDESVVLEELALLQRELDLVVTEGDGGKDVTLIDALEEVAARWKGFVVVTLEVDDACRERELGQVQRQRITHIVAEAITNAVRHGHASGVSVAIARGDASIDVVVEDDGTGPRAGSPGGGSTHLDALALGGWRLVAAPAGGSRLEVSLAHEPRRVDV